MSNEPHEDFVKKVIEPKFDPTDAELRKNARVLGQALRLELEPHYKIGTVPGELLATISLFTAVKPIDSQLESEIAALKHLAKPK